MTDQETVTQVHDLLARNYVEDDDEMFRCKHQRGHHKHSTWALHQPPKPILSCTVAVNCKVLPLRCMRAVVGTWGI
jgi:Myristoyl-CoA:protein N-myristoyltransferase, N-terminal domain